jgi:signal transduction histidine kinase
MQATAPQLHPLKQRPLFRFRHFISTIKQSTIQVYYQVRSFGYVETMDEYEQRKLRVFNQLNFFQLMTGLLIPVIGLVNHKHFPQSAWLVACLPALVSIVALYLNKRLKHNAALFTYFFGYPFATCIVYLYGMNLGISLSFILYGILAVFFIRDTGYMIFSICFSIVSYFLLAVVLHNYNYQLRELNNGLYLFNQAFALIFIFYGLFLVKEENTSYHEAILSKHHALEERTEQVQKQTERIEQDAAALKEVNTLKNKLFSVVAHDLKAPMYALRNLFNNVQQKNMSITELRSSVPDIVKDINYTVSLMDNLLQWARAQMDKDVVQPAQVHITESISDTLKLLRLQANAKSITIDNNAAEGIFGFIDKDMLSLVLRNLLSNAIKFTPVKGNISIGVHEHESFIEIYVKDSGTGISSEAIRRIHNSEFYSTKGTASESGTGLGLMLCKEFLLRNGSQLHIESDPGQGSIFSFPVLKTA